mgnify:CR=1 FL=1
MKIYNRWGEEIFQSNSLNSGWDGTFNGAPAEGGIYIWTIRYDGYQFGDKLITGNVTLVR